MPMRLITTMVDTIMMMIVLKDEDDDVDGVYTAAMTGMRINI